ncbi:MAG: TolC family protein [Treponema sp.]|jgi:outer membrane protein TolC|nr:TolC family protein [Treponema sp.]
MKRTVLLFSLIIITGIGLSAQTISLEQARVLALANSRSLAKYDMSIRSSVLDERSQLYSMLPSVSAGYSASMSYLRNWVFLNPIDTFDSGLTLSVTQKIFEGGKSFIQKSLSSIATESVRKEALAEYFNVIDSADNAYYAALEAAASLEAAESSLQTAVLSLSIAEIRRASGMLNQGDYLKALADKETRENSRNQARRNLSLNIAKLRALIGITQNFELEQIDFDVYEDLIQFLAGISDEEADVLYDRFWNILAQANPSLARAALNNQRAEKNLSLAKRDFAPTISATIFSTGLGYSAANGFSTQSAGGISIKGDIPIDFWIRANRIEKSEIARNSAALDYINAEVSLETELQSSLLNTFAQAGSVLSSRRSLEYAEKHLEYVMERYRLSQSSVSDLGEASSLLITSRNNLIRASYGFLQSLSKLRSLGAIDDEQRLMNIFQN